MAEQNFVPVKDRVASVATGNGSGKQVQTKKGLSLKRFFTTPGVHPFDEVEWVLRTASIQNEKGKSLFEQTGVEVPQDWSQTATNIVASKYFHGKLGTPERETSLKQLISRVADTIADWGSHGGYFKTEADGEAFRAELTHLLVRQKAAFNSPVWFNCGLWQKYNRSLKGSGWYWDSFTRTVAKESEAYRHPQCSACFINSVQDDLESILGLAKTEGMLFKWGSGTGTNLSSLRSASESLSGGGSASGPLSFMRGYDAFAGVIKSGGKTRRAAKMVILNISHPDIVEFIECKAKEERKAWALVEAGYDASLDGEAYSSIFFQNANNSVRVTDGFMNAVVEGRNWSTQAVVSGLADNIYPARGLMQKIADAAWQCGDPGMQFDTIINRWHTCKVTGPINASNPCSEYMFLDDSACNLASLNLMRYLTPDGRFDVEAFRHAVEVVIIAQEILVDNANYPTEKIARNSHDYRPLGLGYANLGALLMSYGHPYDSEAGREFAATVTALMHGQAYLTSSALAAELGPFAGYQKNRDSFLEVISMHRASLKNLNPPARVGAMAEGMWAAAQQVWEECYDSGVRHGYRNAQMTVLAPTGTIGFMMDCDTTGVEPDLALVKYKKLVGGGMIEIVNNVVPTALLRLGYSEEQASEIVSYIDQHGTIEGAPFLQEEHLPVFDCSLKPAQGVRSIQYMGHIRMMAAVQPFLSGAISKTVNMPESATPEEIIRTYTEAWRLGVKAIAIYRDGSKRTQPLNTTKVDSATTPASKAETPPGAARESSAVGQPYRRKLANERQAITHKFSVGGHEGFLTVGLYQDGSPGEIFLTMAKEGSTVSGLMDCFARAISFSLQYGVPLRVLCDKFSHMRFEPSGWTNNPNINYAKSIIDYIFRWLALKFLPDASQPSQAQASAQSAPSSQAAGESREGNQNGAGRSFSAHQLLTADAPSCADCGALMLRNGSCYKCLNCGSTSGCS